MENCKSFYFNNPVPEPAQIRRREFGYRDAQSGLVVRHLSFANIGQLRALLLSEAPADVYCSAALYEEPEARPMSAKNWLGCELVFDIDGVAIDDLQTAKDSVQALVAALQKEMAVKSNEITVYYSGNKGFHVHVDADEFYPIDSIERAEICTMLKHRGVALMDAQVTCDIRRIFRMPGTINSKTGLPKVKIADIDSFSPPPQVHIHKS